jgi:hypothetical protein
MVNRRSWRAAPVVVSLLAATAFVHCSGQVRTDATSDAGPAEGHERGPCYGNGTCNAGLTCLSNVCVNAGVDANVTPLPPVDAGVTPVDPGDSGIDDGGFVWDEGGFDSGNGPTLYQRLGQRAGIAALLKHSFEDADGELADPQLLSYFYIRTAPLGAGAGGAPSLAVVEDCFTNFLAKAVGGPEPYPFTSAAGGANFMCRDMATAHAGLGVTSAAFQKFVSILAARFVANGVSTADLQTVGGALLGTASDIVDKARIAAQQEAGVDAAHVYGARCTDIVGGAATAPGCTNP